MFVINSILLVLISQFCFTSGSTVVPCNPLPTDYKFIVDFSPSGYSPSYTSVSVSTYKSTLNYVYACGTSGSYALITGVDGTGTFLFSKFFWSSTSICASIKASSIEDGFYIFGSESSISVAGSYEQYIGKYDSSAT
jgi:hypothetical protein